ncbi:isoprenylcysteine carboxylmethyltransferase family protein [candidate division KSB1 bacterium]|nr:isoprenylcysteine carboxylmethyltransferase family protein [candidate division KSB1 bacterium]
MNRWGIGKEIFLITLFYSFVMGLLTIRFPQIFIIQILPNAFHILTGTILLIIGIILYLIVLKQFNRSYKQDKLITTGAFARSQHPLYAIWIFFIFPGIAIFFKSWAFLTIPVIAFLSFKYYIKKEKNHLEQKFGQYYHNYQQNVPELFPFRIFKQIIE